MSFFDNIKDCLGLNDTMSPLFRAVVVGDEGVYFEGIKSVKSYSPDKIELCLKSGTATVKGENLYIKKYCGGDLAVCGKVKSYERD